MKRAEAFCERLWGPRDYLRLKFSMNVVSVSGQAPKIPARRLLLRLFCGLTLCGVLVLEVQTGYGQLSKGNQIIMNRGFQVQALASTYDTFHLSMVTNANY